MGYPYTPCFSFHSYCSHSLAHLWRTSCSSPERLRSAEEIYDGFWDEEEEKPPWSEDKSEGLTHTHTALVLCQQHTKIWESLHNKDPSLSQRCSKVCALKDADGVLAQHALAYAFSSQCLFFLLGIWFMCHYVSLWFAAVRLNHTETEWKSFSSIKPQRERRPGSELNGRWTCRPVITALWSHTITSLQENLREKSFRSSRGAAAFI